MKILIAAKHPPGGALGIGGVQSWSTTVAQELERRGHSVSLWGPEFSVPDHLFDLGLFANAKYTSNAMSRCRKPCVVVHGIVPAEEPPTGVLCAFTSEEVREHWKGNGPIIPQPIDLTFWQPSANISGRRPLLVRYSYRDGLEFLKDVADDLSMEYIHVKNLSYGAAREVIQRATCVLATGRAALESLACGAPVVICDHRNYQGALLDTDIKGSRLRNYSGRGGVIPTRENVTSAILEAVKKGAIRNYVKQYHDAKHVVDSILRWVR